ncbi:MAG: peptidoglycan-binding domain-containing protein [Candidatus Omnitrophica bacterium]|nr:peptidoglycan-binding domain-containing protein [Candidatus Omnitrophota bacterium]
MKRFVFVVLALGLVVYLVGCGKKQEPISETQEPISMEELGKFSTTTQTASEVAVKSAPAVTVTPASTVPPSEVKASEAKLEQLPPSGPYKPAIREIQTALKNAGFYTGKVDGKSGPMTKKAIEDFQKANNLSVDGKVGPKTWTALSRYMNIEPKPAN